MSTETEHSSPDDGDLRFLLAEDADERTTLTTFLDFQRDALVRKCAGLSDEQLRQRSVPTSSLTLLGLVRHLAAVERWYVQAVVAGGVPGRLFTRTDDPDEEFHDVADATGEHTFAVWAAEVEAARRVLATADLDDVRAIAHRPHRHSVRWVLNHLIDEYARHLGQADLIREAIDGQVGE
ncbi:DinB family protein [Angustibacter luteus]|uniref:DinB family protein n=1 Tax=Angustibacter luteus TaxID=658456 RepID=A0ABW1JIX9_9ACTN